MERTSAWRRIPEENRTGPLGYTVIILFSNMNRNLVKAIIFYKHTYLGVLRSDFSCLFRFTIGNNVALLRSNDIFIVGKNIMAALCGFDGTVLGEGGSHCARKSHPRYVSRESSEVYQKIWSRRKREYNKILWLSYQLKSSRSSYVWQLIGLVFCLI